MLVNNFAMLDNSIRKEKNADRMNIGFKPVVDR